MFGGPSGKVFTANFAIPITITLVGRDTFSSHIVLFFPPCIAASTVFTPLEITEYSAGATTLNVKEALSEGWSLQGIQWCARLGQLSAKNVLSPYLFREIIKPSSGTPL